MLLLLAQETYPGSQHVSSALRKLTRLRMISPTKPLGFIAERGEMSWFRARGRFFSGTQEEELARSQRALGCSCPSALDSKNVRIPGRTEQECVGKRVGSVSGVCRAGRLTGSADAYLGSVDLNCDRSTVELQSSSQILRL